MKEASKTLQKIIVAYDESAAARDALSAGIELCKLLGTPLQTITGFAFQTPMFGCWPESPQGWLQQRSTEVSL